MGKGLTTLPHVRLRNPNLHTNNTAHPTGTLDAPGYDNVPMAKSFTWSYLGNGRYR